MRGLIFDNPAAHLPVDGFSGALAGRVWRADADGPSVVAIRANGVFDVTREFPTMRDLCETHDPAAALRAAQGERLGALADILAATPRDDKTPRDVAGAGATRFLAPLDLQAIKAAGVTFAVSMLERVIEERTRGDAAAAAKIRAETTALVGGDLKRLKPGSAAAMRLKQVLNWNNPEPEIVVVVASDGRIVGATLGNDVNLRDVEGRSALLLGKAKDNNASCAVGPFIRFFDSSFSLDDVRAADVSLKVEGADGFVLEGCSSLSQISRDPADLVAQTIGAHHRYPDGAALFLGTMFAPIKDRDAPGQGFTHKPGDVVTISTPKLGALVNRMRACDECEPWTFGAAHLMRNLARRGLL